MEAAHSHEALKSRIDFIDGLRGVAISAVILFHAFARWPDLYIYGNKFVGNPVLDTDFAGVNLFFIVSGFVILMTLRKCNGFTDFIARRWYRLFPAMFWCSVFVLLTSGLFSERPRGDIHFWDLLPGLTFVGDGAWHALTNLFGVHVSSIEAAFWSLYVEVRFYIVFGLAYFFLGERTSIGLVFFVWLLGRLSSFSENHLNSHFGPWHIGGHIFSAIHETLFATGIQWLVGFLHSAAYGFFATGALFFLFHITRNLKFFWLAVTIGLLSSISRSSVINANLVLTLLFIFAMSNNLVRHILGTKALVVVGFVSYPLYLLHENMMVAMIVKIGRVSPQMPAILIPVLPICVVFSLAWVIAKYVEPTTRAFLDMRSKPNRRQSSAPLSDSRAEDVQRDQGAML